MLYKLNITSNIDNEDYLMGSRSDRVRSSCAKKDRQLQMCVSLKFDPTEKYPHKVAAIHAKTQRPQS